MPTNVLCFLNGDIRPLGACEIYRCTMPLSFLAKHYEWDVTWMFVYDMLGKYFTRGRDYVNQLINAHDLFVFARLSAPDERVAYAMEYFFQRLHEEGKHLIYEVDDDYSNEFRQVADGDPMRIASNFDAITVTTPFLAERMERLTGRPAHVLPNMIDPELWKKPFPRSILKDKLIIGLTGSPSHYDDWSVVAYPLRRILSEFPNVHLVVAGFHPDYLTDLPQTSLIAGLPYEQYAQLVKHFDIVLVPVNPDDGFNMGKSPIKAIEGMGACRVLGNGWAGAAVIATDMPVYRLAVKHEETGLLAEHTEDGFYEQLRRLVVNTSLRHQLQRAGYRWVWKRHDIKRGWRLWKDVYSQVLAKPPLRKALVNVHT